LKQVFITGIRKAELREVKTPVHKEDWALVKIIVAPMCTEFKQYASGKVDNPLGHEAAGEVVEVCGSANVKPGDRVVVMPQYPCGKCELCLNGEYIHCENNYNFENFTGSIYGSATYAQYILKPSWLLPAIPEDISYENGSMLCCGLGPTFSAMEKMDVKPEETVLIAGMGPVGLGGIINAVYRGAKVIGVTKNEYRANLAMQLGADIILDPDNPEILNQIFDLTDGKGAGASIDCAGSKDSQTLLINATKRTGRMSFVAESGGLKMEVSRQLIRKGLNLFGIWHYNLNGVPKLFDIVRSSKGLIDSLITHSFPIDKIQDAWELQLSGNCGKVIINPWVN
jgi:L-iditol 2-dehydrogenase